MGLKMKTLLHRRISPLVFLVAITCLEVPRQSNALAEGKPNYDAFANRYEKNGQFGFANKSTYVQGVSFFELMMLSKSCRSHLELSEPQCKKIDDAFDNIRLNHPESFDDPWLGQQICDILDLSQQAKLAGIIMYEEGLLGLRYHFVADGVANISKEQRAKLKRLINEYHQGEVMNYTELLVGIPKGVNVEDARRQLREHARSFDQHVWDDVLDDKLRKRLNSIPRFPAEQRKQYWDEVHAVYEKERKREP